MVRNRLGAGLVAAGAMWSATWAGCVQPSNPCDPNAPPDVRAQGTAIAGHVVDQNGGPLAGVAVGIVSRSETAVSASDGSFLLENLPPVDAGYELTALVAEPQIGGRVRTPPLLCQSALADVDVVVVVPPASPEVEITKAMSESTLFVAFGAADGEQIDLEDVFYSADGHRSPAEVAATCADNVASSAVSYRVQVRPPFDTWYDAVLLPMPWAKPPTAEADVLADDSSLALRVDPHCAAAMCQEFAFLEPRLADARARCAEAIGYMDGTTFVTLEPYGSYQVRVLTELSTAEDVRAQFALPARVVSAPAATVGQMSLVPGALLPVADASGEMVDSLIDVKGIVASAGQRFTVQDGDAIVVTGDGSDVLTTDAQLSAGTSGVSQGAIGTDEVAGDQMNAQIAEDMAEPKPLAWLAAGTWVRVLRMSALDSSIASIAKVYLGEDAAAAADGVPDRDPQSNGRVPQLPFDMLGSATRPRVFSYLMPPGERMQSTDIAQPPDSYLLLYGSSVTLIEQAPDTGTTPLAYFANPNGDGSAVFFGDGGGTGDVWAAQRDPNSGALSTSEGFFGDCSSRAPSSENVDAASGPERRVNLCYDFGAARDEDVNLTAVDVLTGPDGTRFHLFADAANARLLTVPSDALTCAHCDTEGETPLVDVTADVPVGLSPIAMLRSRMLSCDGAGDADVVLVANRGSADVSVVQVRDGVPLESAVVQLPAAPRGFLNDPDGPSCADPFVWVITDDGRSIPLDMRGSPSVPLCGASPCSVGTRGRGAVGAVARVDGARGRALVGGRGLLSELGFFRPQALRDAAFVEPVATEVAPGR